MVSPTVPLPAIEQQTQKRDIERWLSVVASASRCGLISVVFFFLADMVNFFYILVSIVSQVFVSAENIPNNKSNGAGGGGGSGDTLAITDDNVWQSRVRLIPFFFVFVKWGGLSAYYLLWRWASIGTGRNFFEFDNRSDEEESLRKSGQQLLDEALSPSPPPPPPRTAAPRQQRTRSQKFVLCVVELMLFCFYSVPFLVLTEGMRFSWLLVLFWCDFERAEVYHERDLPHYWRTGGGGGGGGNWAAHYDGNDVRHGRRIIFYRPGFGRGNLLKWLPFVFLFHLKAFVRGLLLNTCGGGGDVNKDGGGRGGGVAAIHLPVPGDTTTIHNYYERSADIKSPYAAVLFHDRRHAKAKVLLAQQQLVGGGAHPSVTQPPFVITSFFTLVQFTVTLAFPIVNFIANYDHQAPMQVGSFYLLCGLSALNVGLLLFVFRGGPLPAMYVNNNKQHNKMSSADCSTMNDNATAISQKRNAPLHGLTLLPLSHHAGREKIGIDTWSGSSGGGNKKRLLGKGIDEKCVPAMFDVMMMPSQRSSVDDRSSTGGGSSSSSYSTTAKDNSINTCRDTDGSRELIERYAAAASTAVVIVPEVEEEQKLSSTSVVPKGRGGAAASSIHNSASPSDGDERAKADRQRRRDSVGADRCGDGNSNGDSDSGSFQPTASLLN